MGSYNPRAPFILGEEWVPIRDELAVFSPQFDVVEQGHGFSLAQSRVLQDARFYIDDFPPGAALGQTFQAAVYPRGYEDNSGPIRSVVIPCNSAAVTGSGVIFPTTVVAALADPSDLNAVEMASTSGTDRLGMFFATSQYPILAGKRILAVNLLYSAAGQFDETPEEILAGAGSAMKVIVTPSTGAPGVPVVFKSFTGVPLTAATRPLLATVSQVNRIRLGEINHWWSTAAGSLPSATSDRMPWRYDELLRFEASASNRLTILYTISQASHPRIVDVLYAALEVVYCEEQRVAYGARMFGDQDDGINGLVTTRYVKETNIIPMRSTAFATNPVLAAADYTAVLSSADMGDLSTDFYGLTANSQYPKLNALRELYAMPSHPGIQVNIPYPAEDHLGETLTSVSTHVLPQLSLHASGGPLTEVHVYGTQVAAPVYGSVTAIQDIYDDVSGVSTPYPQVRYYARRFGDTTVPLLLDSTAVTGVSVQITPGEHDALAEIIDGWKEVNLRFTTAPNMGTVAGNVPWRWSATGENAGNRWEVLGAMAPAVSGVPGNLLNLVPSPNQLGTATYGAPNAGSTVELTWLAPPASGVSVDNTSDAVLIFSQDPPAVSGLAVVPLSQPVTGVALDCGYDPPCIPTGIGYHRVTWTPVTALPASGFGAYELQRYDTVDTTWQTIMSATSSAVTGFADYEARVGVESRYRIRSCNVLDFCGLWSAEVPATLPTPGVYGQSCDNSVLMFTSNSSQTGRYNLAHTSGWENELAEDFVFPEAGRVRFQTFFDRDFQTAFHGTERGGERFARTLLVNAAAISLESLANFRSLRDMAWADLPYVCVRDELGNRWFANVLVPGGSVRRNRRLYLAPVEITEVTDTPCAVDPNTS